MYRKVKCRLASFVDVGEEVQKVIPTERDGEIMQLVEYRVETMEQRSKTSLNPNVVTTDALINSGQYIQGSVFMPTTDLVDLQERAESVANYVQQKNSVVE